MKLLDTSVKKAAAGACFSKKEQMAASPRSRHPLAVSAFGRKQLCSDEFTSDSTYTIEGYGLTQYKEVLILALAFALTNPREDTHQRFARINQALHSGCRSCGPETERLERQLTKGYFADIHQLIHFNEREIYTEREKCPKILLERHIPRCIEFIQFHSCYYLDKDLMVRLLANIATASNIYSLPNVSCWFKACVPDYFHEFERGRKFLMNPRYTESEDKASPVKPALIYTVRAE